MKRYSVLLILAALFLVTACKATPENTEIVVSDAIISNDDSSGPEIAPNATVYKIAKKEKQLLVKYLLGKKLEGVKVQFYARDFDAGDDAWIQLGEEPLLTDENGRAVMQGIRQWLPAGILSSAPVDLQLRADVVFREYRMIPACSELQAAMCRLIRMCSVQITIIHYIQRGDRTL